MSQPKFLVIDLEATCDDGGLMPRREMEIIEIGAVVVDPHSFAVLREFQTFVRPVIHALRRADLLSALAQPAREADAATSERQGRASLSVS